MQVVLLIKFLIDECLPLAVGVWLLGVAVGRCFVALCVNCRQLAVALPRYMPMTVDGVRCSSSKLLFFAMQTMTWFDNDGHGPHALYLFIFS